MTRVQPPRTVAVVAYLLFSLAGAFFMFWSPTVGMKTLLGSTGYYIWNWFLLAGGGFGAVGAGGRNFRIEVVAVPFLVSSTAAYSLSLLPRIAESPAPGALAGLASIFMGIAFLMVGQGVVLWKRLRAVADIERRATNGQ